MHTTILVGRKTKTRENSMEVEISNTMVKGQKKIQISSIDPWYNIVLTIK